VDAEARTRAFMSRFHAYFISPPRSVVTMCFHSAFCTVPRLFLHNHFAFLHNITICLQIPCIPFDTLAPLYFIGIFFLWFLTTVYMSSTLSTPSAMTVEQPYSSLHVTHRSYLL